MELQVVFGSSAYCFAEQVEELRAKPVHLVIDEYVELRDENGDYVTQQRGQTGRFDLSIYEAEFMIRQLQQAIAESNAKLSDALEN